jgi:alanine dehydrogenase
MKIGLPKEIKDNEYRVGLTPAGVNALVNAGHTVFVQKSAGEGSGFTDDQYVSGGAKILDTADDVWAEGDMIVKVKEPIAARIRADARESAPFHLSAPCSRV